ncbi:uncharacterized protein IL334_001761 [Kwoniella shivajii]|uniref:Cyclic nucleotide-binding domain-containing protein n=1 Tax=Kwoniella shivajii TaxID=564305 RepID=A0ABZ1CST3_9TREE|nr:hypothetical protein IL334_001761 [Kwoniella shivajii]
MSQSEERPLHQVEYKIDHSIPLNDARNVPSMFNFMIQHLDLTSYLSSSPTPTTTTTLTANTSSNSSSSLLTLQRTSKSFFNIITPLIYRDLIIDLKDAKNPTSISPFHFYPNPQPKLSEWKSRCFAYTENIEFVGSHAFECEVFQDCQLVLPRLRKVRITLPSGRYKSFCGKDSLLSLSSPRCTRDVAKGRSKEDGLKCPLLQSLKMDKLIVEVDRLDRINLFARRDWFDNDELIIRIGRVGEDYMIHSEEEWPVFEEQEEEEGEEAAAGVYPKGKSIDQGKERYKGNFTRNVKINSTSSQDSTIKYSNRLNLIPSLDTHNTTPNLTIIFLSLPSQPTSKPLSSEDIRSDHQRINHHLFSLANILSFEGWQKIVLVNSGVLMFHKYGIRRDIIELRKMQLEIKDILLTIMIRYLGLKDFQVKNTMDKIEFTLLDDYLNQEREREDEVRIKAKSGEKSRKLLY